MSTRSCFNCGDFREDADMFHLQCTRSNYVSSVGDKVVLCSWCRRDGAPYDDSNFAMTDDWAGCEGQEGWGDTLSGDAFGESGRRDTAGWDVQEEPA